MFDVFYSGTKPNLFAHEQAVDTIEQAQQRSRTRFFWFVNYLSDYSKFDFLWEPVPWQSHQRHAWPSQWQKDGETYLVPAQGYTETHYRTESIVPRSKSAWADIHEFDYTWHPDPSDPLLIYQFGTQWQKTGGPRLVVPGAVDIKYVDTPRCTATIVSNNWSTPADVDTSSFDFSWHPDDTARPYIYQFGTQWQKTGGPRLAMPGAVEIKYIAAPRCVKTSVDTNWTVPKEADVATFDFSWHPDATVCPYIYQFGTQHQRTGGPRYAVAGATDTKYVDQLRIKTKQVANGIYEIDHMDGNAGHIANVTKTVRYFDNYLDTLRRLAANVPAEHEFIWICSSVCDYTNFDFSWHPEKWQSRSLHVFASDNNKFGDTFFMHVPSFNSAASQIEMLDWYDLNFVETSVPRRPLPVIRHANDSQVDTVKSQSWAGPLAIFTSGNNRIGPVPCVSLWREKTKTIVPLTPSGSVVIVPRVAVPYIKKQLYDYPYVDKTHKNGVDMPLDVVFISNGEVNADYHWDWLLTRHSATPNRTVRIDGVKGRVAAYQAAASASNTDWFFAVFAKLEVDSKFDWSWQPDMLQQAKHYIFHARNSCNGLEYGHQAMIAYNKRLTLENTGSGLDFTMDQLHEVVPILSGIAYYTETPWMAWRTAFREVLKLKLSLPDVENEYRLRHWLGNDRAYIEPQNSEWSVFGATDALEYYDDVKGEFAALKKSYEWEWLASYAFMKRNILPV
jgi:hypothetical protein